MPLDGPILPLTTPFLDGKVALDRLRHNLALYAADGPGGYLVLGSTGEAALLDQREKLRVIRAAREAIPPSAPLVAGVGLESTAATIGMAGIAADAGADLLLVLTPHYYGERMDDPALTAHYLAVADASPRPILLYDVPRFTHVQLSVDAVAALSHHERIVGIKDSSADTDRLSRLLWRVRSGFQVLCGHHAVLPEALRLGIRAAVLAAADVLPEAFVRMHRLAGAGSWSEARELHEAVLPASELCVCRLGVPGIKAAMDCRGLFGGAPRAPLLPVSEEARVLVRRELEKLVDHGILGSARGR